MHHWLTDRALKMVWLPAMAAFAAYLSTARLSLDDEEGVSSGHCWCSGPDNQSQW